MIAELSDRRSCCWPFEDRGTPPQAGWRGVSVAPRTAMALGRVGRNALRGRVGCRSASRGSGPRTPWPYSYARANWSDPTPRRAPSARARRSCLRLGSRPGRDPVAATAPRTPGRPRVRMRCGRPPNRAATGMQTQARSPARLGGARDGQRVPHARCWLRRRRLPMPAPPSGSEPTHCPAPARTRESHWHWSPRGRPRFLAHRRARATLPPRRWAQSLPPSRGGAQRRGQRVRMP